jgi:hypothetical protein
VKIAARPFTTDETELAEQGSEETALLVAALNQQAQPETVLAPSSIQNPSKPVPAKPAPQPLKKSRDEALSTRKAAQKSVHRIPVAQSTTTPSPQKETRAKIAQLKKLEIQDTETILSEQQVLDFVENWRLAWTSKQIEPYIAFYDRSFRSGNKDLEGWKAHKAKLNRTYSYISVEISDIDVRWTDAGATVSFKQEYRSDLFKAAGIKTLHLVYSDLGWKIKRETFSRI